MTGKQKKVTFYEKSHKYKLGRLQLTSVTQFVGKFFEKFDSKAIAKKLASYPQNRKNKKGVRFFLKEWKQSSDNGTKIHKIMEDYVNGIDNTGATSKSWWGKKFIKDMDINTKKCLAEWVIHSEELGLAGTIDLAVLNDKLKEVTLIDWKSNKKITSKGYGGKKGSRKATADLDDCHTSKYGLQLSTYAYILEIAYGYKIRDLLLVHLLENDYKVYPVPYDKERVIRMLKEWNDEKENKKENLQ